MRKRLSLLLTLVFVANLLMPASLGGQAAAPVIGTFSSAPIVYNEAAGNAVRFAPDITITNEASYMEFSINGGKTTETLNFVKESTASTVNGVVSIVGQYVYLGDGTKATIIGSIDQEKNGEKGKALGVNFSKPLNNATFTDPMVGASLPGWTILQGSYAKEMRTYGVRSQGKKLFLTTNADGSTTLTRDGIDGYSYTTTSNYLNPSYPAWGYESVIRPRSGWASNGDSNSNLVTSVTIDSSQGGVGGVALKLKANGNVNRNNNVDSDLTTALGHLAYGSEFGPVVISEPFTVSKGDNLSIDWKAVRESDDYEVYGFVVDEATDKHTIVFYNRGMNQDWTTSYGVIPEDGTYRFKFVNGTYDQTGGYAVGSSLWIDNIRVFGSVNNQAAVVQQIARLATYASTDKDPDATRTLSLYLKNAEDETTAATGTIQIANRFNHPTTVTTTVQSPTFFNLVKNDAMLFSNTVVDTIEAADRVIELKMTVTGLVDGNDEILKFDGTSIPMVNGATGTTAGKGMTYTVTESGGNGTLVFTSAGVTGEDMGKIIDAMAYYNSSASAPELSETNRVFALTQIKDSGGTANSGVDTTNLSIGSNVVIATRYRIGDFKLTNEGANSADFTWRQPTGATGLKIKYKINDGAWQNANDGGLAVDAASGTVTGLSKDTQYYFKLEVTGGQNAGDSNIVPLMLDGTEPEVTSIVRANNAPERTGNTTVVFTVTFTEETYDVSTDDFDLSLAGGLTGDVTTALKTSPTTYDVTVSNINGEGSIRLQVKSNTDIADLKGNKGVDAYTSEEKYDVAKIPLVLTGVADGTTYESPVTISFNVGSATLNGQPFVSGTTITDNGVYTLVVTEPNGNQRTIHFKVDNPDNIRYIVYGPGDSQNSVTQNLDLMLQSEVGDAISWQVTTTHPSLVITTNGALNYTTGSALNATGADIKRLDFGDVWTTFVATVKRTAGDVVKTFNLLIKGKATYEDAVKEAIKNLAIGYQGTDSASRVLEDISLPSTSSHGAKVSWQSDSPEVISPEGKVTRPGIGETEKIVNLTATVSYGDAKGTVVFKVKVRPFQEPIVYVENVTNPKDPQKIDEKDLEEAYKSASAKGDKQVTIVMNTAVTTAGAVEVTLDKDNVINIKNKNLNVKLETKDVAINVPVTDRVVRELTAAGSNSRLAMVIEQLDTQDAGNAKIVKDVTGSSPIQIYDDHIYEFKMKVVKEDGSGNVVDETVLKDYQAGEEFTLSIYVGKDGFSNIVSLAYYYNPDTENWEYVKSNYDEGKGQVNIVTDHLSIYSVMYIPGGDLQSYLVTEILNRATPMPTITEVLNIIRTPEMALNLKEFNRLPVSGQRGVASGIINNRPEAGYTYGTFVTEFERLVLLNTAVLSNNDEPSTSSPSLPVTITDKSSKSFINRALYEVPEDKKDEVVTEVYMAIASGDESGKALVTVKYDDSKVNHKHRLTVYGYDEATGQWKNMGGIIDPDTNEVIVNLPYGMPFFVAESKITYKDIEGHWAKEAIETLAARGIFLEDEGDSFEPGQGITRQEMTMLLVKMAGYEPKENDTGFTDVPATSPYANYISIGREKGLITGISDTLFEPERIVLRQEIAAMVMRLFNQMQPSTEGTLADGAGTFDDDKEIYDYARDHIYKAKKMGIVKGRGANKFEPVEVTTKAEAMMIAYRLLKELGER